jgi:hypothetical protein
VGSARVPGWLVECLRLGVGHASTVRPDPSTLGVVGERGSRHEGRSRPLPGHSRCDLRDPAAPWRDVRAFSAEARGRGERITTVRAHLRTVHFSGDAPKGG